MIPLKTGLAALMILAFAQTSMASGSSVRGGGDEVALEFHKNFATALQELKEKDQETYSKIAGNSLAGLAQKVKIVVVDDALDIKFRDLIQNSVAVNTPAQNLIMINRARWNDIQDSRVKEGIALHEILSLKGLEQTGLYPFSAKYLTLQGLESGALNVNLTVDRLQQIKALNPKASPFNVLEKFFSEAKEPISLNDFNTAHSNIWRCQAATSSLSEDGKLIPRDLIEISVEVFQAILKDGIPGVPDRGPLFPATPEIPPVRDSRINLKPLGAPRRTLDTEEWHGWKFSTLTSTPTELVQKISIVEHTTEDVFRMNSGLVVARQRLFLGKKNPQINQLTYTYCYKR